MADLFSLTYIPALNSNGVPEAGAQLEFLQSGTSTRIPVYANAGLTTTLTNPVVADGSGRFPDIYLDTATYTYRARLLDADGAPMGYDVDPYILPVTFTAGLFADLGDMTIPTSISMIRTTGYTVLGKGAAWYKRSSGLPAWGDGKWWSADAGGAQWELAETEPATDMFGTLGDAAAVNPYTPATSSTEAQLAALITGTDVTTKIQDCVDYCLYRGIADFRLSNGRHKTTDTIHLGYGDSFYTVRMHGVGSRFGAWDSQFGGSAILCTKSDRPIINIQGGRRSGVYGVTLFGLLAYWIAGNRLGYNAPDQAVAIDDTDIANWSNPHLSANQDARYAPFAGICIDGYSGVRPGTSYPDVTYPSWTGISTQYGKNVSSDTKIEDCVISGVVAPVVIQPSNVDANADFTSVSRTLFYYTKYMISVGNSQSRNVSTYDCLFNSVHTLFEGRTHGKQLGRFQGPQVNLSGSSNIQIMNVNGVYANPWEFNSCYFEGSWRIGNIVGSAANPVVFNACHFAMPMAVLNNTRGQPTNHLSGSTTRHTDVTACQAPVRFVGCTVEVESVFVLLATNVHFDGVIRPQERESGTVSAYQGYAHNGLAGGLVVYDFADITGFAARVSAQYKEIDASTGAVGADVALINGLFRSSVLGRKYGCPIYTQWLQPAQAGTPTSLRVRSFQLAKSTLTGGSLTGRVLTVTDTVALNQSEKTGKRPGDVWIDRQTGTVFFVTSHDTGTRLITLKQQNNWKGNGGSETAVQSMAFSTGTWQTVPTRNYTPDYPLFVDSTSASAVLSNAGTADANTADLTSGALVAGDYLALTNYEDNTVSENGTTISSINGGALTITLSANASITQTRKRLSHFRAAPPANVTAP